MQASAPNTRTSSPGIGWIRSPAAVILGDKWKRLGVPTDLVWGEEDAFLSPSAATQLVDANPSMRLHRIPDAGHLVWIDQPEQIVIEIERSGPVEGGEL